MKCDCRRLKKNYPFGRKSRPNMYCKDCGEVVSAYDRIKRRNRK